MNVSERWLSNAYFNIPNGCLTKKLQSSKDVLVIADSALYEQMVASLLITIPYCRLSIFNIFWFCYHFQTVVTLSWDIHSECWSARWKALVLKRSFPGLFFSNSFWDLRYIPLKSGEFRKNPLSPLKCRLSVGRTVDYPLLPTAKKTIMFTKTKTRYFELFKTSTGSKNIVWARRTSLLHFTAFFALNVVKPTISSLNFVALLYSNFWY